MDGILHGFGLLVLSITYKFFLPFLSSKAKMQGFHGFFIVLLWPIICTLCQTTSTLDTLHVGQHITGAADTRSSMNGVFKLGFFNLNNDTRWYLGIWFTVEMRTIWVANKDNPFPDSSAILNITNTGTLLLTYGGESIWSSDNKISQYPSIAVLEGNGNLVLKSVKNNSEILWQSFDEPGNTWLEGMRLTAKQWLRSWRGPWDPSTGPFSLGLDPQGSNSLLLMANDSIIIWNSGEWNGSWFPNAQDQSDIYRFNFFDNGTYKYCTFTMQPAYKNRFSNLVLYSTGQTRNYLLSKDHKEWNYLSRYHNEHCVVFGLCGSYGVCSPGNLLQPCSCLSGFEPADMVSWGFEDYDRGCMRQTALKCKSDEFIEISNVSKPASAVLQSGINSYAECKSKCLRNCSCSAFSVVEANNTCLTWFVDLYNMSKTPSSSIFVRVGSEGIHKMRHDSKTSFFKAHQVVLTAVCVAVAGFSMILLVAWVWSRRMRDGMEKCHVRLFRYRELEIATKNFTETIGKGGFGSVFKGKLRDGKNIAVKRLRGGTMMEIQGEKQFRMEVSTIGNIQHVNVVRLLGFCSQQRTRLLVYEFMSNGSLDSILFTDKGKDLDWKTRYSISMGIAKGMVYLHEHCRERIIHCDIKPENVLLDSYMCPKIADFGMAKMVDREFSRVLTTMRGTRGYLAPEWIAGHSITPTADVYSYGMTLLEIVSGTRNILSLPEESSRRSQDGVSVFFPVLAGMALHESGTHADERVLSLVDERVRRSAKGEEVRRLVTVAMWCIQDEAYDRPSMGMVLQVLQGVVDVPRDVPPIPLSLLTLYDNGSYLASSIFEIVSQV